MEIFDQLAEGRIAEAMARGEFERLPGRGKPLPADDHGLIPPAERMALRILKNAGVVPNEVALRKEISEIETLLQALPPGDDHNRAAWRRNFLLMKLSCEGGGRLEGAHLIGCLAPAKRGMR